MGFLRMLFVGLVFALSLASCREESGPLEPDPTTGTLTGVVTDAVTGAVVAGVALRTDPVTQNATTDAQGAYTFPDIPPAGYTVAATKDGYISTEAGGTITAGQTTTLNVALQPDFSGSWSGTTSQGRQITFTVSGLSLTALEIGWEAIGSCNTMGTFHTSGSIAIEGNTFVLEGEISGPTALSVVVNGTFQSGATVNGDAAFALNQTAPLVPCTASGAATWTAAKGDGVLPGTLAGTVTDSATGLPLEGATVTTTPATATVHTDAEGEYVIADVPAGDYAVGAERSGYHGASVDRTVTLGSTATADFALAAFSTTGSLTGTVLDAASGDPIAGATVTTTPVTTTVTTDGVGTYTILDVAPDTYTVTAAADGYISRSEPGTVTPGTTASVDFTLDPDYSGMWSGTTSQGRIILFTVADNVVASFTIGHTVSGISCTANGTTTTGFAGGGPVIVDGDFAFDTSGSPPVQWSFYVDGTFASGDAASGNAELALVQTAPAPPCSGIASVTWTASRVAPSDVGTLTGTVTDDVTGLPLAGAAVTTTPVTATVAADEAGVYTIPNVAPGSYTVTANQTGYVEASAAGVVAGGAETVVDLTLAPVVSTGTLTGTVTDAVTGLSLAGVTITTVPATSTAITDAFGAYTIPDVDPASYTVTAALNDYVAADEDVTVPSVGVTIVDFELSLNYAGAWAGTTSQGRGIQFIIAGNAVETFAWGWAATGSCDVFGRTVTGNVALSGNTFSVVTVGNPPVRTSIAVNATLTSGVAANGDATVEFVRSAPHPSCSALGSATWTASRISSPTTGAIVGFVMDADGFILPGVSVSTTPATTTVATGPSGLYAIPSVTPGTYTVTGTLAGFTATDSSAVVVAGTGTTTDLALTALPPAPGAVVACLAGSRPILVVQRGTRSTSVARASRRVARGGTCR